MPITSFRGPRSVANPTSDRDRSRRGPNLGLLSVAVALAITISMAESGTLPQPPYSTVLLLGLAAALMAVLKP
jgi:hypothetical protein